MSIAASIPIAPEALLGKSRAYISKALKRLAEGELEEYQLWASLALELLGKAALAHRHPCLIVDPLHAPSLFVAAGISATTDVKTIAAKTLFERLKITVEGFDEAVRLFCMEIAERRNAELHSGDAPFRTMKLEAWEGRYWHACHLVLVSMDSDLNQWIGEGDAADKRRLIELQAAKTRANVMAKITAALKNFNARPQKQREAAVEESKNKQAFHYHEMFHWRNDHEWGAECICCKANGFLAGDKNGEEPSEAEYDEPYWESINVTYSADEFVCPVCQLHLIGQEEVSAAGFDLNLEEIEEREIEHEPEYGNC